jgi:hypothetical protein
MSLSELSLCSHRSDMSVFLEADKWSVILSHSLSFAHGSYHLRDGKQCLGSFLYFQSSLFPKLEESLPFPGSNVMCDNLITAVGLTSGSWGQESYPYFHQAQDLQSRTRQNASQAGWVKLRHVLTSLVKWSRAESKTALSMTIKKEIHQLLPRGLSKWMTHFYNLVRNSLLIQEG